MASPASPFEIVRSADESSRCRRNDQGRFVNLDGTGPHPMRSVLKWAARRRKSTPPVQIPSVPLDPLSVREPPRVGQGARLTWLGHASWLVQVADVSMLIDPIFGDINFLERRKSAAPLPIGALPKIDAQLVTHNHYDHMNLPSLSAVGAPVVAGLGSGTNLGDRLAAELGWWDSVLVGCVRVTFVPSQHWSRRGLRDENQVLWGGVVIEGDGVSIYHSGDTAYAPRTFQLIGQRFPRLDVALLPIGAYDPRWFMSRQHMDPAEAVKAFADLGARRVFAMHWGTFKLTDEPLDEPPRLFRETASSMGFSDEQARVLSVGETATIQRRP